MAYQKDRKGGVTVPDGTLGTTYRDGDAIVTQDEPGDCMYVIQAGRVEVIRVTAGRERRVAVLSPGSFFGEMAIFEQEARAMTIRALGEARVLRIDKKTLLRRINEDPLLAVNLLKTLSARLRETNRVLGEER